MLHVAASAVQQMAGTQCDSMAVLYVLHLPCALRNCWLLSVTPLEVSAALLSLNALLP